MSPQMVNGEINKFVLWLLFQDDSREPPTGALTTSTIHSYTLITTIIITLSRHLYLKTKKGGCYGL